MATQLGDSGFDTIILGFWHVSARGTISYGGPENSYYVAPNDRAEYKLADLSWVLTNVPKHLKQAGKVKKVLLSFGGWAAGDLNGIKENLSTFQYHLKSLFKAYPDIDGIDCDFEKDLDIDHLQTMVSLVKIIDTLGKTITAAPYNSIDWWLSVLSQTHHLKNGGFAWWNLQCAPNCYNDWKKGIMQRVPGLLEPEAENFLTWMFTSDTAPADVTSQLHTAKSTYPGLVGTYIWNYEGISAAKQTSKYAQAVISGLTNSAASPPPVHQA